MTRPMSDFGWLLMNCKQCYEAFYTHSERKDCAICTECQVKNDIRKGVLDDIHKKEGVKMKIDEAHEVNKDVYETLVEYSKKHEKQLNNFANGIKRRLNEG